MVCNTGIGCGGSGLLNDLGVMGAQFLGNFGNPAFTFLFSVMLIAFIVWAIVSAKNAMMS